MLREMKEQLKNLAQTDSRNFHVNLRARIGKKATNVLEDRLKEIVVLMPDLVQRIYHYWENSDEQSEVKNLGGYLLTYLYTPKDYLSSDKWGLFGYLDDAYFTAKIFTQVIEESRFEGLAIQGSDLQYYEKAKYLKRYVRGVIPKETGKIDALVSSLKEGNEELYERIFV